MFYAGKSSERWTTSFTNFCRKPSIHELCSIERNEFNFGDYFSYRVLDTASILKYLFYKGVVNEEISSLDKAIGYFDITIDNRHSALSDATVTAKLFSKLLEL